MLLQYSDLDKNEEVGKRIAWRNAGEHFQALAGRKLEFCSLQARIKCLQLVMSCGSKSTLDLSKSFEDLII